jgi:hypothetical protein
MGAHRCLEDTCAGHFWAREEHGDFSFSGFVSCSMRRERNRRTHTAARILFLDVLADGFDSYLAKDRMFVT